MAWSWRDLRVFLFLFLFSLVVWTTRLMGLGFDPYQASAPPQLPSSWSNESRSAEHAADAKVAAASTSQQQPLRLLSSGTRKTQPLTALPIFQLDDSLITQPTPQIRHTEQYYRLVIPAIKVDTRLIPIAFNGETWDVSTLGHNLGILEPLEPQPEVRNLAIAGHFSLYGPVPGPFRYLSRLVPGAQVFLYSDRNTYIFQVSEQQLVSGTDLSVLAANDETLLTLLTCDTWDEKSKRFLRRRIVRADLVELIPLSPLGVE